MSQNEQIYIYEITGLASGQKSELERLKIVLPKNISLLQKEFKPPKISDFKMYGIHNL
jgi:hypothetical protein